MNTLPCRFCGCSTTTTVRVRDDDDRAVQCLGCWATGPHAHTKREAIERWNRLAPQGDSEGWLPIETGTIYLTQTPSEEYVMTSDRPAVVVPLPVNRVPKGGASWLQRAAGRSRLWIGKLLSHIGVGGMIGPVEVTDSSTGQTIVVIIGPLLTRVRVNGRDYYFDRFTGRYDGTGQGCA